MMLKKETINFQNKKQNIKLMKKRNFIQKIMKMAEEVKKKTKS